MASRPSQKRASGSTAAEEEAKKLSEDQEKPLDSDLTEDDLDAPKARFRTPGFSRMRIDWVGDDAIMVRSMMLEVDKRIDILFEDIYGILSDLWDIVREIEREDDGAPRHDGHGLVVWKKSPSGNYIEDWTKLTRGQKEDFMFRITTRIWDWEQRSANLWGEAMLSKAQWEERFAIGFNAPQRGTVDDRNARGKIDAAEERYFAVLMSLMSRKAEGLVRSMTLLSQRLESSLRL